MNSYSSGVIITHNLWTIPTDNISCVSLDNKTIFLHLKDPVMSNGNEHGFNIQTPDTKRTKQFYDTILKTLHGDGIAFIPLNYGDTFPKYEEPNSPIGKGLLVINNQDAIPTSNIGAIVFTADFYVQVFLRRPIKLINGSTKTYFSLSFKDQTKRQKFHDSLVMAIWHGCHLNYDVYE